MRLDGSGGRSNGVSLNSGGGSDGVRLDGLGALDRCRLDGLAGRHDGNDRDSGALDRVADNRGGHEDGGRAVLISRSIGTGGRVLSDRNNDGNLAGADGRDGRRGGNLDGLAGSFDDDDRVGGGQDLGAGSALLARLGDLSSAVSGEGSGLGCLRGRSSGDLD